MDAESAETIVALLVRIDARLAALEKRFDDIAPSGTTEAGSSQWNGEADRRVARQPFTHEERRKLSGEV